MKRSSTLAHFLNDPAASWQQFYEATKIHSFRQRTHVPESWIKTYYKGYARFPEIALPQPTRRKMSFGKVLYARHSGRSISQKPITTDELSILLYYAAGQHKADGVVHRFYPSAGARYPLEVYVLLRNSTIGKGLFHYYVPHHSLENMWPIDEAEERRLITHPWMECVPAIVFITGVFKRSVNKYRSRGYNFTLMEAGHMGQLISLVSASLSLSACPVGGFYENTTNEMLEIDGKQESCLYMYYIGHPR